MASAPNSPKESPDLTRDLARRVLTPIAETVFESDQATTITTFHSDTDLKVIVKSSDADPTVYMDEAPQDRALVMTLEGDPRAIATIFRIVHYDFVYVPKEPTLKELYELAKCACQYKCTHVFHPWADGWLSRLHDRTGKYSGEDCLQVLYIGWAVGDLQLYKDAAKCLVLSTKLNSDGKIVTISGQRLEAALMPPYILDIITEIRTATLAKILAAVKAPIQALSFKESEHETSFCKVGECKNACETMLLGAAVAGLTKLGLFPVPEPEKFTGSIEDLKHDLEKVKSLPFSAGDWHGKDQQPFMSHHLCSLQFKESVTSCIDKMELPLCSRIMGWISSQADTCGIKANKEIQEWRLGSASPSKRAKAVYVTQVEEEHGEQGHANSETDTKALPTPKAPQTPDRIKLKKK